MNSKIYDNFRTVLNYLVVPTSILIGFELYFLEDITSYKYSLFREKRLFSIVIPFHRVHGTGILIYIDNEVKLNTFYLMLFY